MPKLYFLTSRNFITKVEYTLEALVKSISVSKLFTIYQVKATEKPIYQIKVEYKQYHFQHMKEGDEFNCDAHAKYVCHYTMKRKQVSFKIMSVHRNEFCNNNFGLKANPNNPNYRVESKDYLYYFELMKMLLVTWFTW